MRWVETLKAALDNHEIVEAAPCGAVSPGDRERERDIAEARRVVEALGELDFDDLEGLMVEHEDQYRSGYYDVAIAAIRRITGSSGGRQ
jgi:hypothetical protein